VLDSGQRYDGVAPAAPLAGEVVARGMCLWFRSVPIWTRLGNAAVRGGDSAVSTKMAVDG
jgi:hypothetical protein